MGRLRLACAARGRQRPGPGGAGLRRGSGAGRGPAPRHPLRHADGQGRALPGAAREEPFHPRRSARVAAGPSHPGRIATPGARPAMNMPLATPKPRPTTSAMIASIAAEGQRVQAAPFGKALVELAASRPDVVGMTADLAKYTDLHLFAQAHPERFFQDRKSTRLNSSHLVISYAVFC